MIIFNLINIRLYMILQECYHALGLSSGKTYTTAQLRKAYFTRAKATHPDINPQDPTATQSFQHLTQCYEYVMQYHKGIHTDTDDTNDTDDTEYTVEEYKMLFEQWSSRASYFWNTSTEAKLIKQMWNQFSEYASSPKTTETQDVDDLSASPKVDIDCSSPPITKNTEHSENADLNIHFTLQIPLEDIYHMHTQKLSYQRREQCNHKKSISSSSSEIQNHSLLVNTSYQNITFYCEGHQCSHTLRRGNVLVHIEPDCPLHFYIDAHTQVLHYVLHVSIHKVGQIHILHIFGIELFVTLSEEITQFCFPEKGLYDVDKDERSDLIVNIEYNDV